MSARHSSGAAPGRATEQFGDTHAVLRAKSRRHYWAGVGPLSIKSFVGGQALYEGAGRFLVDDRSYLVLNQGQPYSVTVDSHSTVDSFCVFFTAGFAEEVFRSLTLPADNLLSNPAVSASQTISFFERTYLHDNLVSPALFRLRCAFERREPPQAWLDEQLHDLMERLLQAHRGVCAEVDALPAARPATREELYRRLHRAREYAHASLDQPLTLDELARVAGLSPNHFLRTFKRAFQQTPHQYLTELRLERARYLLLNSDALITEICFDVGFESLGSFSWLFRRRVGCSPQEYRARK